MALTGLNARGYKNSTLLFNLARVFIARSPARALINPPWTRHRRADVAADADPPSLGLLRRLLHRGAARALSRPASPRRTRPPPRAARSPRWSSSASSPAGRTCARRTAATRSASSPRWRRCRIRASRRFFAQIKQDLGFGIYVPDCDTTACSFSAATQAGSTDPILDQPLLDFYAGYQVGGGGNEPLRHRAAQRQHRLRGRHRHLDRQPRRRAALSATISIRRSISTCSKSASAISRRWKVIETPQRLRHRAAHHRLPAAAGRSRRVRQSALAYLLSAGALLRLFRPLLRGLHRAAAGRAARRSTPTARSTSSAARCWPMSRTS